MEEMKCMTIMGMGRMFLGSLQEMEKCRNSM